MASKLQSKTRPHHVLLTASISHAADAASWYCAFVLVALILLSTFRDTTHVYEAVKGTQLLERPCDEIYVVGEGETLHTISDKCGDPFIVEQNPHIHDPDDVFPGLVIRITPSKPRKFLR
ncbi:hypothetical protein I3843_02G141700 [Carya illinoinensis]|uniref:LysM domain-containing protein n=1 Tax=Carya illinoinensis TaxID=32201 RepID=A0A8T1RHE0_CARIL|nr:hypothetical protein I3760_02G163600 [Carya illinoinensis]KAG6665482.1 hypothetical protein CIPAW_02G164100 [Carya illinoinensis]KAG6728189.1 hypothetical protein I3842_02G161000 [Carya illinoinensis]KAG7992728.1 hypothetical protein I3843_02G141700 [Carya illinoinensis]